MLDLQGRESSQSSLTRCGPEQVINSTDCLVGTTIKVNASEPHSLNLFPKSQICLSRVLIDTMVSFITYEHI